MRRRLRRHERWARPGRYTAARASHWQLAASDESLAFLLVGWSLHSAPDRDDGMPSSIASTFVKALLRVGKLTYPSSSAPQS